MSEDYKQFPIELIPTSADLISLPSGKTVLVPKATPRFKRWEGEDVPTFGGKAILDIGGEPLYAELAIVRLLQGRGWNSVWANSYRRTYLDKIPGLSDPLPKDYLLDTPPHQRFGDAITTFGGIWDVVAWAGDDCIFAEGKRSKKDAINENQEAWLEARLADGATPQDFLLVEWEIDDGTINLFELSKNGTALVVETGRGGDRIATAIFKHPHGIVFADIGWHAPLCSFHPFHVVKGNLTFLGTDPDNPFSHSWKIGDEFVRTIVDGDQKAGEWNEYVREMELQKCLKKPITYERAFRAVFNADDYFHPDW